MLMAVPTKSEILDFSPINRGGAEELPTYRREQFDGIRRLMGTGLIVALTGLRRVGKTTLMKQALGKDACYFSFDERQYANPDALKAVLRAFLEEREKPVIALDEVFRVEDWAGIIKKYHDQKRARFIVGGSSSLMVKKGVESLSGRLFECYVPPLRFAEFLEMCGKQPERLSLADAFNMRKRHGTEAEEFMLKGSFPETVGMDTATALSYMRTSTVEKIVFDDIPSVFRIEHPAKLYDLLRLCATSSSRLFSESGFAEALQINRHTVADYLLYLSKSYLTDAVYPVGSFQKVLKKQKKIFVKT